MYALGQKRTSPDHVRSSTKANIQVVAYDTADQNVRSNFGRLVVTIAVVLEATRAAMATDLRPETTVAVAENATGWLKPLIGVPARSSADVNRVT